jgi:hypothetical protein
MDLNLPLTHRRDPADLADLLWRPASRMIAMRSGFGLLVQFQPNSIAVSVLHYPSAA